MSELRTRLNEAVKSAMRAGDKARLGTLRLATAALKQREVDERIELTDDDVVATLSRMVKQRRESIAQFEQAGRADLVAREQAEIDVLSEFLPQPLSEEEIAGLIEKAIAEAAAESMRDMGKVMAILRPQLQGRADVGTVSARVKQRLGG